MLASAEADSLYARGTWSHVLSTKSVQDTLKVDDKVSKPDKSPVTSKPCPHLEPAHDESPLTQHISTPNPPV